jgi:hypothetical protein
VLASSATLFAQSVPVRHPEGTVHGFMVIHTLDKKQIAVGELIQVVRGDRVTTRTTYRFKDGSIDDDIVVFSQRGVFRLISDHQIQKGPSFPHPSDVAVDAATGQVTVHSDDGGKEKVTTEHVDVPPDLANGMILTLLKNLAPGAGETKLSLLTAMPKVRMVKLAISTVGEDPFTAAGAHHKAMHYVVKIKLGGIEGAVAPIVGKQPHDIELWIVGGSAPALMKMDGPTYEGGPVWQIEQVSAVWPASPDAHPVERK